MATILKALVWFRTAFARLLFWLGGIVEILPAEDPFAWEVSVVKVAAAAESHAAASGDVYRVTRELDGQTIHQVLLLLAADVAWSKELGAGRCGEWADTRKFHLMVADFDDVD